MTGFYPHAVQRIIPPGANDPAIKPRLAILHVDAGNSESLYTYFRDKSGGIESHFFVKSSGEIEQYRGIYDQADANLDANDFAVSIETQGYGAGTWNAAQLASIKRLLLWLHSEAGIPLRVCQTWYGSGVGYHTMFGAPGHWTPVAKTCPGPDRVKQFDAIIRPWLKAQNAPPPVAPYRPGKMKPHDFGHWDYPNEFIQNSDHGTDLTLAKGLFWIDNDFHLTADGVWVNAHGDPEAVWGPGRFEDRQWAELKKLEHVHGGRTYRLRNGNQALKYNASVGMNTEIEAKNLAGINRAVRRAAMARLARSARRYYGPDWQDHVVLKVRDRVPDALLILTDARAAGIPTMLSVRGANRFKTYAGHREITWLRGSLVLGLKVTPAPR